MNIILLLFIILIPELSTKLNNTSISFKIPKEIIFNFLFLIFILAFIVSPYWIVPNEFHKQIGLLLLFSIGGFVWSKWAAQPIKVSFIRPDFLGSFIFFILFLILNIIPLINPISYLGDEIHHFLKPLMLNTLLGSKILFGGLILGIIGVGIFSRFPKKLILLNFCLIIGSAAFFLFFFNENIKTVFLQYLVRYPFFPSLIHAIPPAIGGVVGFKFSEGLYRIIPFLSSFGIIWLIAFQVFSNLGRLKKITLAISLATVPIVFYYSSILYLEMPIVFLLTIILVYSKKLLSIDQEQWQNPGWIALLLLGFFKETILPLIAAFIAIKTIYLFVQKVPLFKIIKDQSKSFFCLFFPILLYLFFRGEVRGYRPDFSGLISLEIYQIFFASLFFQFGILLFLFVLGAIFSFKEKVWIWLLTAGICGAILLFYTIDSGGIFVGYSRFNLFFIPLILLGFCGFVLKLNSSRFFYPILLFTIFFNLFLSPINIDGSRNVNWENCIDCKNMSVDMVYPYHEALEWYSKNYDANATEFTIIKQREYYYPYKEFYRKKYKLKSNLIIDSYDEIPLNKVVQNWLKNSKQNKSSLLIQSHRKEELNVIIETLNHSKVSFKIFENNALSILIAYE